jgi:3',5'-cyclic AMP phosphodiesterase CpdA
MFLLVFSILASAGWAAKLPETPIQRIAVISDLNGSYGSTRYGSDVKAAMERLTELKPSVVLATGDLVAGQKAGLDYRAMWKSFHLAVTRPLREAGIPLAVTVGNHDGSGYPKFAEERRIFEEEWKTHLPAVKYSNIEHYPFFYSFESGDLAFIALDTTRVGPLSGQNLDWLESELRKQGPSKTLILFAHVPMFHFADIPVGESYFDSRLMELIRRFEVKLYLTGHHHSFYPGYFGSTHFVSQSCLGSGPTRLNGAEQTSAKSFTVIDFYADRFEIYALKAPLFIEKIDTLGMPHTLDSAGRTLRLKESGVLVDRSFSSGEDARDSFF